MDRLALLAEDNSSYSRRMPVALGTKTLDSIMYAMKEGEIELLDEVWRQTKTQRSFSKLHELMDFQQAAITCAEKQGLKPPQFEDHTPYSNKGMEDLLDIDEHHRHTSQNQQNYQGPDILSAVWDQDECGD